MKLEQEISKLRKALSLEQDKFEDVEITDDEINKINQRCGIIKRKIRRAERYIHK